MMAARSLLIDRAAAAERPTQEAVAEWAVPQRIFVSSVIERYAEPRKAAVAAIEKIGAAAVWFERFGGRDSDPNQAYLDEVRSSDIYIGLLGARYGRPLPSRFSATHEEYREAEQHGLRLSVWAEEGVEREGPQQSFLDEVRQFNVTGSFSSPEELEWELGRRLVDLAAEDLSPWCKLGHVIFRAREITEGSGRLRIRATVKDPQVTAELGALNDQFARRELPLTYGGRTLNAQLQQVEITTRAARSREALIEATVSEPRKPTTYSYGGMSWDDMTDLAVRVSILGQPNPLGIMSAQAEIPNPLPEVGACGVSAEALRAVCELVLTEVLVVHRGVERVLRLRLGADVAGRRAIQLEWSPTSHYGYPPRRERSAARFRCERIPCLAIARARDERWRDRFSESSPRRSPCSPSALNIFATSRWNRSGIPNRPGWSRISSALNRTTIATIEESMPHPETHCVCRGPRGPDDWANALRYYQKLSEVGLAPEVLASDGELIKTPWYQPLPGWRGEHSEAEWKRMGLKVLALVRNLHHRGVCHRDLHVGNIVVRDGEPLLIDLEFATAADPAGPCYDLVGPGPSGLSVPDRHAVQPNANRNGVWWDADNGEVETCGRAFGSVAELQARLPSEASERDPPEA